MNKSFASIPPNFLWGVANSAFQVEGHPADSDWRRWTQEPERILDASNAETANEFWQKPEKEIKLAQELGAKAFRISLAWERIETSRGSFSAAATNRYREILQLIRTHGMTPVLTLNHFVLPYWLSESGGYLSEKFVSDFVRFSGHVWQQFSKDIDQNEYWLSFNEPGVVALQSYINGAWPPGEKENYSAASKAITNMAEAHIRFADLIQNEPARERIHFGFAQHVRDFQPADDRITNKLGAKFLYWIFNDQFISSLSGNIFSWMPGTKPRFKRIRRPHAQSTYDFIGLNYYGRMMTKAVLQSPFLVVEEGPGTKNDLGWEIYPEGLYSVCKNLFRKYKKPIFITENGLADSSDTKRTDFIREHLKMLERAIAEGIDVIGYLHWTLSDNFEWAEGLKPKFGLVETLESGARKPRPSYYYFKSLIESQCGISK